MLFDLLVIGVTHECKAYVGVFVNARGKKSSDGAGTKDENVEGISNSRHTGSKMSIKCRRSTNGMNVNKVGMAVGPRHDIRDLKSTYRIILFSRLSACDMCDIGAVISPEWKHLPYSFDVIALSPQDHVDELI